MAHLSGRALLIVVLKQLLSGVQAKRLHPKIWQADKSGKERAGVKSHYATVLADCKMVQAPVPVSIQSAMACSLVSTGW